MLNEDVDAKTRANLVEELFQLHAETRLLTEIMDIQDELNIVRAVLTQQRDVLDKLLKIVQRPEEERERSDLSERSAKSAENRKGQSRIGDFDGGGRGGYGSGSRRVQSHDDGDLDSGGRSGYGSGRGRDHNDDLDSGGRSGFGSSRGPDWDFDRRKNTKRDHSAPPVLSRTVTVLKNKGLVTANIDIIEDNMAIVGEMLTYARNVQQEVSIPTCEICT